MLARILTTLAVCTAMTIAVANPAGAGGTGATGGHSSGDIIEVWVASGGPGGGVRSGGASCDPWKHAAEITPDVIPEDLFTIRMDSDGTLWDLYFRICDGAPAYVWVPRITAVDLGEIAFDQVKKKLPKPTPLLSPDPASGGWVNFETWLAVNDPGTVTATAQLVNLSATATARVTGIEWTPGDGASAIVCKPFGSLPPSASHTGRAPCGHTFVVPSHGYAGSVTLVWSASWTASNGATGDLGEVRTTLPLSYRVREIQTIGVEG